MARMETTGPTLASPVWAGDYLNREHLVPGGAHLDAAAFTADAQGRKNVVAGTAIGRTYAERDAGTGFGPASDLDDEIYLVALDVTDAAVNPAVELYRHGSIVKENFLPNWAGLSAAVQAAIRDAYDTTRGAE